MIAEIDWTGVATFTSAAGVIILACLRVIESRGKAITEIRLAEIALKLETIKHQGNETKAATESIAVNVEKVEKATNSMKDALIVASRAEGVIQGRAERQAENS